MLFDRSRLRIEPLAERTHDLGREAVRELTDTGCENGDLAAVADRIHSARQRGSSVVLMLGAHVLRDGVQRYVIDWMERNLVTCVAMNGAGVIHDYELALIGATTESVARYISEGQFGLWRETGVINDIVTSAARAGLGMGEAVGRAIEEGRLPHRDISVLAAGVRTGTPVTAHVGIGYDIVFQHPNCDGGAYGATSYRDFLRFAHTIESLEGGVLMNFGSSVMAPEVYLKALAMARNVAKQEGRKIAHLTTLVCDLQDLPADYHHEPVRGSAAYYFRPWKTMLVRTVADGGESFYVRGRHAETIPQLWSALSRLTAAQPTATNKDGAR
ncbi:MAG: hypothetical protein HYX75_16195 [Acidobacteria bacterium]|nr:hypothetical protein [Acidobacteriota bacterium]